MLARLFRGSEQEYLTFPAYEVPMCCPPKPWISVISGGYLVAHADVVRLPTQAVQQWQRLNQAPPSSLYPSLDSLNQLASVPWAVNKPVLDVILEVFNSGESTTIKFSSTFNAQASIFWYFFYLSNCIVFRHFYIM